jgi:hypothetical protein
MSLKFIWATIWLFLFFFTLYTIILRPPMLITDGMNDACPLHYYVSKDIESGEKKNGGLFDTKSRCFDTGIHLQAGERYEVTVDDSGFEKWKDASIPSNPEGFDNHLTNYHPFMIALFPIRRHLKDAWFVVMGKIGRHGTTFRVGEKKKVTATETGRLYLYVNDAIMPFCEAMIPVLNIPMPIFHDISCSYFYDNNKGLGQVYVRRLAE